MQIRGILQKTLYQNSNYWGIYSVQYDEHKKTNTANFTGVLPDPLEGQTYIFEGEEVEHPQYGKQFKFTTCSITGTDTKDGAFALLTSNRFKGIGVKKAQAIVDYFGDNTLKIIREQPERLIEVPGITEKLAKKIIDNMPDFGIWEELRSLLVDATDNAISKIYEIYGAKAIEKIKENPYNLIKDIDGYGFFKADAIAKNLGITGSHPLRIQAAIFHCLEQAAELEGHCFSYANNLQLNVKKLIPEVDVVEIAAAIKELMKPEHGRMQLHLDPDGAIYLQRYWQAETGVAQIVKDLLAHKPKFLYTRNMVEAAAETIMHKTGICLDETQKDAVYAALNNSLCLITGGPGTGKTTIVRTIIETIKQNGGPSILKEEPNIRLLAPTGRAARRLRETTEHMATTIQLPSAMKIGFYNDDFLICDETSMVDILLAYRLLKEINSSNTRVIFIGDIDQLPPIGAGIFFRDLLESVRVPKVRLKFSFRQNGSIAQNANKMNNGIGPHAYTEDEMFHFYKETKESAPNRVIQEYLQLVKEFGVAETVILSPTRKRGEGGTNELNKKIQNLINPDLGTPTIQTSEFTLRTNDRVMLTKNGEVEGHANGDVGTIIEIRNKKGMMVLFDNDVEPFFIPETQKNVFTLAYAMTIHKSQGSEYKGVIVIFTTEHQFMGERALLYTGVTRAKDKCLLIGDARAISAALNKVKPLNRNSKLKERINS